MSIRTTNGLIDPGHVKGKVLAHEHLVLDLRTERDATAKLDDDSEVTRELSAAREHYDLQLVVDLTCRGMGRDVRRTAKIAGDSGVDLVVATGYYYERFHPRGEIYRDPFALADFLVEEAQGGLDGTEIKPGVLGEIGTGSQITQAEGISLRAAAQASNQLALSIATHAHLSEKGIEQVNILTAVGVSPARICIGHQDLSNDRNQLVALADMGVYLGFDTIGKVSYQKDSLRLQHIDYLVSQGFENQILLSNDISRTAYLESSGGLGYAHALSSFADALKSRGFTCDVLDKLYRQNALNWLEGVL